jgi:DNA-binding transcriptional MerR regulator
VQAELTIGEFSRITHLSVKTLRHYHRVGLLEPDSVNEATGYRYYGTTQVGAAHTIRRLRDLEMPIDDVRAVLAAPDVSARDALLATHLDRMQQQLTQTQSAVAALRDLLERPRAGIEIEHRTVAAMPALAMHATVTPAELGAWWSSTMVDLRDAVDAAGLEQTGPLGGVFDDELFTDEQGDAVLYIPVSDPPATAGRASAFTVPPAALAVATYLGPHDSVDRTYAALGLHVAAQKAGAAGPVREHYLVGALDTTDVAAWVTEICWPL